MNLGHVTDPDGNSNMEFEYLLSVATEWHDQMLGAKLTHNDEECSHVEIDLPTYGNNIFGKPMQVYHATNSKTRSFESWDCTSIPLQLAFAPL